MKGVPPVQVLVFQLQAQEFALPIAHVAEVLRMVALTPVPHSPAWHRGLLNLRGQVIPVIDLCARLGLSPKPLDLATPLLIVQSDTQRFGAIADSTSEVLMLEESQLAAPDAMSGERHLLLAVARAGTRVILILDAAQLAPPVQNNPALGAPA